MTPPRRDDAIYVRHGPGTRQSARATYSTHTQWHYRQLPPRSEANLFSALSPRPTNPCRNQTRTAEIATTTATAAIAGANRTPPELDDCVGLADADDPVCVAALAVPELPGAAVVCVDAPELVGTPDSVDPPCTSNGVTASTAVADVNPPSPTRQSAVPPATVHDSITVIDSAELANSNTTLSASSMTVAVGALSQHDAGTVQTAHLYRRTRAVG